MSRFLLDLLLSFFVGGLWVRRIMERIDRTPAPE